MTKTIWKITENPRISQTCWGDFRFNLCLPRPRGGHRWTRLVPQFDFLQLSSKSGLWEAISWPMFIFEKCKIPITKIFFPKTPKDLLIGCWGYMCVCIYIYIYITISTIHIISIYRCLSGLLVSNKNCYVT